MLFVSMILLPLVQAIFYQNPQLFVGRYLMPVLGAFACILAAGWERLNIGKWLLAKLFRIANSQLPIVLLSLFALLTPLAFLTPAYNTPISRNNQPALLTFEDVAQVTNLEANMVYLQDKEGQRPYADIR
ncbi:MAG: hypothetical protein HC850_06825, partial [Rhodomicrobium sp.]|nr:hypothetical protein [Rhodomicrobium sp.]